jgi:hypothetical protein
MCKLCRKGFITLTPAAIVKKLFYCNYTTIGITSAKFIQNYALCGVDCTKKFNNIDTSGQCYKTFFEVLVHLSAQIIQNYASCGVSYTKKV